MGLVLGTYSISNYAMAASQDIGKIAPTDKILPFTVPPGFEKAGMVRVISSTTSEQGISDIQQKGCSVVHRLNDATSFSCPSGVVSAMDNVRPVKVYYPHDLDADIQINADKVWNDLGFTGTDVIVAVLDTGVQASQKELSDSVLLTEDFTDDFGDNLDWDGHGTHVSGIVTSNGLLSYDGDSTKGVAPGANVLVGKVCGVEFCLEDDIVYGIEWAESHGADIINMSLGGGITSAENCDPVDPNDPNNDEVVVAVNKAVENGIVVTISSGNDYDKNGVSSPACASGAIAVGASNGNRIASFSNTGPAMDIVAPGVSILSTYSCNAVNDPLYPNPCVFTWAATLSGTSMSSPHVAGVVALMLEKNPDLTVAEIKEALYSTAKKIQNGKFDGNGRVDALAAVNYVSGPPGPDLEAPVITAAQISNPFAQTLSDKYVENCTVTDNDLDYAGTCSWTGGIDTTVLGIQSVTYTAPADEAGNGPVFLIVSTTIVEPQAFDNVEIIKAEYRVRNGDLRVQATSDTLDPLNTTLTVVEYGDMKNNGDGTYQLRIRGAADPGNEITVTSSSGGEYTALVIHR